VNNTFVARFGDRVGWTFLDAYSVIVFAYDSRQKIFFHELQPANLPTVGSIRDFDSATLPVVYSIAVLLDLSKKIVCRF